MTVALSLFRRNRSFRVPQIIVYFPRRRLDERALPAIGLICSQGYVSLTQHSHRVCHNAVRHSYDHLTAKNNLITAFTETDGLRLALDRLSNPTSLFISASKRHHPPRSVSQAGIPTASCVRSQQICHVQSHYTRALQLHLAIFD